MPEVFKPQEWVLVSGEGFVWVSMITTADGNILIQSNEDEANNGDILPPNGIYSKTDARDAWAALVENGWKSVK